jgi:hypothetical protein
MVNVRIISLMLVALIITGCKDNPFEPVENESLMPLGLGNYWLYQGYYLNDDGSVNFPQDRKYGFIIDDTLSQIISGRRTFNYKLFNCGEELKPYYDKPGSFEGSKLIYQNTNGLNYSGNEKYDTIKMVFNDLIFPFPTEIGRVVNGHVFYYSTLGNNSNVPDDVVTQYTCVSIDSLFSTPLGDFKCIVYKMSYADFEPLYRDEVYYFIKPGIGIVGFVEMVYHYSINKYTYFLKNVLTTYKINEERQQ